METEAAFNTGRRQKRVPIAAAMRQRTARKNGCRAGIPPIIRDDDE